MSGYFVGTAEEGEQYSDGSINSQNEPSVTTDVFSDTSFLLQEPWHHQPESTGGLRHVWSQDQIPVFTESSNLPCGLPRMYHNPTEHIWSPECIDPTLLALPGPQNGASSSSMEYVYQYPHVEALGGPSVHSETLGSYSDINDPYAHACTACEYPSVLPDSLDDQHDTHIGSGIDFLFGALDRPVGYREALSDNTDQLMAQICVPSHDSGHVYQTFVTSSSVNPDLHNEPREYNQDKIVPPQPLSIIKARQSLAEEHRFQYFVTPVDREGTPVNANPKTVGSQSTRTFSGRLEPYVDSHHSSDAPSPTSTATSTDVTICQNCESTFTGKWQKSNRNRHLRQKHVGERVVEYPCEDDYCTKSFRRTDARLKHYRKKHPNLNPGPPRLKDYDY